jgi:hypothetical protein
MSLRTRATSDEPGQAFLDLVSAWRAGGFRALLWSCPACFREGSGLGTREEVHDCGWLESVPSHSDDRVATVVVYDGAPEEWARPKEFAPIYLDTLMGPWVFAAIRDRVSNWVILDPGRLSEVARVRALAAVLQPVVPTVRSGQELNPRMMLGAGHDGARRTATAVLEEARRMVRHLIVSRADGGGGPAAGPGRHALSNLVGPLLLGTTPRHPCQRGIGHILAAAGLLEGLRNTLDETDPGAAGVSGDSERTATQSRPSTVELPAGVRVVLCDDQWHHGWLDWLCDRLDASLDAEQVEIARTGNGGPTRVAESSSLSIWVASSPMWLRDRLTTALREVPLRPLERNLRLTQPDDGAPEILLLDLRLFANRSDEASEFLEVLEPTSKQYWSGEAAVGGGTTTGRIDPATPTALSLLGRTLAIADPLLPIVLFSSTGRRDMVSMFEGFDNVITEFAKPRVVDELVVEMRSEAEAQWRSVIGSASRLLRRREAVESLIEARARLPQPNEQSDGVPSYSRAGVYIDESGDWGAGEFVFAAIVALYKNRTSEDKFTTLLEPAFWHKEEGKKEEIKLRPSPASNMTNCIHKIGARAEAVTAAAEETGTLLFVVLFRAGEEDLPHLGHFGPQHLNGGGGRLFDRGHRVVLSRCIEATLAHCLPQNLLTNDKCLTVLCDTRGKPTSDFTKEQNTAMKRMGFGKHRNGAMWSFLEPGDVYSIVDGALRLWPHLQELRIQEAKTVKWHGSGHALLQWADDLAFIGNKAGGRWARLPGWVQELSEGFGAFSSYGPGMERLLRLSGEAERGHAKDIVADLVREPDTFVDCRGGGVADRCRRAILTRYLAELGPWPRWRDLSRRTPQSRTVPRTSGLEASAGNGMPKRVGTEPVELVPSTPLRVGDHVGPPVEESWCDFVLRKEGTRYFAHPFAEGPGGDSEFEVPPDDLEWAIAGANPGQAIWNFRTGLVESKRIRRPMRVELGSDGKRRFSP